MKIIAIVGASGVGKDTLLKLAKMYLDESFLFVQRYITRVADENEDNLYINEDKFLTFEKNDFFLSTWMAHNNLYGIAKKSLDEKKINIISISRTKVEDFAKIFQNLVVVHISLSHEMLLERLEKRARESKVEIEKRLQRTIEVPRTKYVIEFNNSLPLELATVKFVQLLKQIKEKMDDEA